MTYSIGQFFEFAVKDENLRHLHPGITCVVVFLVFLYSLIWGFRYFPAIYEKSRQLLAKKILVLLGIPLPVMWLDVFQIVRAPLHPGIYMAMCVLVSHHVMRYDLPHAQPAVPVKKEEATLPVIESDAPAAAVCVLTDLLTEALYQQYYISPREQELIPLVLQGNSNQQIGETLFLQQETDALLDYYREAGAVDAKDRDACAAIIKSWYNGYIFSAEQPERMHNSDMVLYFISQYMVYGHIPTDVVDENVRIDYGKLKLLIFLEQHLNGNFTILKDLLEHERLEGKLVKSIVMGEEIDPNRFLSLLYFLGLITIQAEDSLTMTFVPPNLLILKMLWDYLRKATEDVYRFNMDIYQLHLHLTNLAAKGEWQGALTYILGYFYQAASARDFVFHEEGVKMFVLADLNLAEMYRVESEKAFEQGYSDIFLYLDVEVFPDVRYGYIFELKYLKSRDINTEKKRARTQQAFRNAQQQLAGYTDTTAFERTVKKVVIILSACEVLQMEEVE